MGRFRARDTGLLTRVETLLREAFPPPDQILRLEDDDGIIGVVASGRFRGLEGIDRQNMIWDVLDARLTPEQRRRIVIIAAVTPEEARSVRPLD
jgi:stress-induced morphogen